MPHSRPSHTLSGTGGQIPQSASTVPQFPGVRQILGRQTLTSAPSPKRLPPPRTQASPSGQSESLLHPPSRSSQKPVQNPPQPLLAGSPHSFSAQDGVHSHSPHFE